MPRPVFHLTPDGYFARGHGRIIPLGVNYWPASCGVEMWRAWPAAEIQRDLDVTRALGLNCVRFFLRWEDFEPEPGRYDPRMFRRLAQLLGWCRTRGLLAHPSLFVGWMSGGIFWPEWKRGRNLFADPFMRRRAFAFAGRAVRVCARFRDSVLAVDQGNELCCLPECFAAPPADVASWCEGVNRAVRRAFPDVLLVSGNDQNQVTADTGWRLGAQPGCDFYAMHTYPVSPWHALPFDGMTDPLGQSLFPFYLKCARAFGPVMMQEFGTLFTSGAGCDAYLRAMLPAAWNAGANGFLWWSLRDITAACHPYDKNAFEGPLGLVGRDDRVKPELRAFAEFAAGVGAREPAIDRGAGVALYWPREYYPRENPRNPGNEPRALSRRMAVAHFALTSLGHEVGVVRGDQPLEKTSARTIVVAGASLTAGETGTLLAWVKAGGRLIWHGVDAMTCGFAAQELMGAKTADFFAPRADGVKVFGAAWDLRAFAREVFVGVEPATARVVARDRQRRPVVLQHRLGRGCVAVCLAQPDDHFAAESTDRRVRARWRRWYRGMLRLVRQGG